MPLAFHASPPTGHWINDPNGLVFADGAYRLFVQHRADPPKYQATGWARFSSDDLLRWTFDGVVIPPAGDEWMYSGTIVADGGLLEATHTVHHETLEYQVCRTSRDAGLHWSGGETIGSLGDPGRNRRDPFVFQHEDIWFLLLAEPCSWTDWSQARASCLQVYKSVDRRRWVFVATIGPWSEPGVMWEVPVLAMIDGHAVLFISTVDRRAGRADCGVRAWIGRFVGGHFFRDERSDPEGSPVDLGPDFYALMSSTLEDWPRAVPLFVGWASSWQTARKINWPGFAGGPVSLPRAISVKPSVDSLGLHVTPAPGLSDLFTRSVNAPPIAGLARATLPPDRKFELNIESGDMYAGISADGSGDLIVERSGGDALGWSKVHRSVLKDGAPRKVQLFIDGPTSEIFLPADGLSVTITVPGFLEGAKYSLTCGGVAIPLEWRTLPASLGT